MNRRKRSTPLPGAKPPREPAEIVDLYSDDEKAGTPLPPPVDLTPSGPPVEIIDLYPNPLPPPPPPFDRAEALAGLQIAFAVLTDDELQVVRRRMLGVRLEEIADSLGWADEEVKKLWKTGRDKIGNALFRKG